MADPIKSLQAMCDNLVEEIETLNASQHAHHRSASVQPQHQVTHQSNRHGRSVICRTVNTAAQHDQYRSIALQPRNQIKRRRSKRPDQSQVICEENSLSFGHHV